MTQSYVGTKVVMAWNQSKGEEPGYAVKYPDGYVSWSPKAVFEESYLPIGNIDHLPLYQQRVIAEKAELADKLEKLSAFLSIDRGLPARQVKLLQLQRDAMAVYDSTLALRIKDFE